MKLLITGGAGFIGSNFVHHMVEKYPDYELHILDALTYSGNLENLEGVLDCGNVTFHKGDIRERELVRALAAGMDGIVNFAAESHVDRSLYDAADFISTNIYGAYCLLEAAREHDVKRFLQVSTDEVYGSIPEGSSREGDPLLPSSPYSASKAGADCMAHAFWVTFHLPVMITRSSNNFGPYQYPEKLIPFFVTNALEDRSLPLYGDGMNVRDWIYVKDNCEALDCVLHEGRPGEVYNVGGGNELPNVDIAGRILELLEKPRELLTYVKDRPGHDRRYSLDCSRITSELGWCPRFEFRQALQETIDWYRTNRRWWEAIKAKTKEYQYFMEHHYTMLEK